MILSSLGQKDLQPIIVPCAKQTSDPHQNTKESVHVSDFGAEPDLKFNMAEIQPSIYQKVLRLSFNMM